MNSEEINKLIKVLNEETQALFGIMTPQHTIEHLTITMKLSSSRIKIPDFEPNEKQLAQKNLLLNTGMPNDTSVRYTQHVGVLNAEKPLDSQWRALFAQAVIKLN